MQITSNIITQSHIKHHLHKQHQDIHVTFAFNILLQFHHTKFSTRGFKHIPVKFSHSPHLPTCHLRLKYSPYSLKIHPLNKSEYNLDTQITCT